MAEAPVVKSFGGYRSNAELIHAAHLLGWLRSGVETLDPTYGRGRFWRLWHPGPGKLYGSDLNPAKSPRTPADFTDLPHADGSFAQIVFDPPYKLNGTPSAGMDEDYGVDGVMRWQDRYRLCLDGITECSRVLARPGILLVKCQPQVVSGSIRWQDRDFAEHAESLGLHLVDRLWLESYREQPAGRRQVHSRQNLSCLLVFSTRRG